MLVRLLYASRAAAAVTPETIESILAQSRAHNPALGITGILCHGGDVYMQALDDRLRDGGRGTAGVKQADKHGGILGSGVLEIQQREEFASQVRILQE